MSDLSFNFNDTQVILIGTKSYEDINLPELPAVENNLIELKNVFSDNTIIGIPESNIHIIFDEVYASNIGKKLSEISKNTQDTLLVYYAGHGKLNDEGELCLTVKGTDCNALDISSLPFKVLKNMIQKSPAQKKILIIDSCFSGRAIDFMSDTLSLFQTTLLEGTYLITSVTGNRLAKAYDTENQFTGFTSVLIKTLKNGIKIPKKFLTLKDIYKSIKSDNTIFNEPQKASSNSIDDFVFAANSSYFPNDFEKLNNELITNANTIIFRVPMEYLREMERKNGMNQQRFISLSGESMEYLGISEGEWVEMELVTNERVVKEFATVFLLPTHSNCSMFMPLVVRNLLQIEIVNNELNDSILNPSIYKLKIRKSIINHLDYLDIDSNQYITSVTIPPQLKDVPTDFPKLNIRNREFELLKIEQFQIVNVSIYNDLGDNYELKMRAIKYHDNPGRAVVGIDKSHLKLDKPFKIRIKPIDEKAHNI
jgi:hypothetical protein